MLHDFVFIRVVYCFSVSLHIIMVLYSRRSHSSWFVIRNSSSLVSITFTHSTSDVKVLRWFCSLVFANENLFYIRRFSYFLIFFIFRSKYLTWTFCEHFVPYILLIIVKLPQRLFNNLVSCILKIIINDNKQK